MFGNFWKRMTQRGRQPGEELPETQPSADPVTPIVSAPPTSTERDRQTLETYDRKLLSAQGPDALIAAVAAKHPEFARIMHAGTFPEKLAVIADLGSDEHRRLFADFRAISFHLEKVARYADALELEKLALDIVLRYPETELDLFFGNTQPRNRADTLQAIGRIHSLAGDFSLALQALLEADSFHDKDEALRREAGIEVESEFDRLFHREDIRASLYGHIAEVYRRLGDPRAAAEYNKLAWQRAGRLQTEEAEFRELIGAGGDRHRGGDHEGALEAYNRALELALKTAPNSVTPKYVVEAAGALGDVYADLRLHRRALQYYEKCLDLNESTGHGERMKEDHLRIGSVREKMGDLDSAVGSYREALRHCCVEADPGADHSHPALVWEHEGRPYRLVSLDEAWRILFRIAQAERKRDKRAALGHLERTIGVIEQLRLKVVEDEHRIGYQTSIIDVYDAMIDLLADLYEEDNDHALLEQLFSCIEQAKSRVLLEQLADLPLPAPAGVPEALLAEESRLLTEMEALERRFLTGGEDTLALAGMLEAVTGNLDDIWNRIEKSDPLHGPEYVSLRKAVPLAAEEARRLVRQPDTNIAIAEFYATPRRLILVVLRSDSGDIAHRTFDLPRDELRMLALVNPKDPPPVDMRLSYWELDFAPLVEPLKDLLAGCDLVLFVPHDVLHSIPLHALRLADETTLTQHLQTSYIPSVSLLRYCRAKHDGPAGENLVIGDPHRPDLRPIPQTRIESAAVAELLQCQPHLGKAATRDVFFAHCSSARHIHLACHGRFFPNDAFASALSLADGDLTAREILGLRLDAELVVLSACETGAAEARAGDELIGLVRALLYAGAPSVVVSLWNAYDETTRSLMGRFYRGLINQGLSKVEALNRAQQQLIEQGIPSSQWGPFILIGDWN